MPPELPNGGMGLSGAQRLERFELRQEQLIEMVGRLGNRADLIDERLAGITRRLDRHDAAHAEWDKEHEHHVSEHEARHRWLDARVYGALAGLGLASAYLITQGGQPPAVPI